MRKQYSLLFTSLFCLLFLSSCISRKKYEESLTREQDLMAQNTELRNEITQLKGQIEGLQGDNSKLVKQIDDAMKAASQATGTANMTQKQLEAEQKRLWDLRKLLDQQRQAVENLRKKMSDALTGFNSNELQVFTKNGKVYVSLQEKVLFPSGSAVVNAKGKQALATLAQVLNVNPDINVVVEGHTDSIPIHGKYEDNWALSVARATSIVRLLTDTYHVDPTRVTASGRSKFEPVESNETADGRQRNRRTEIILAPKLDELMQLLQQGPAQQDSASSQ
ncbi:OmpA/MotB family protein [Flavisolibacter ginsengisoli]|uniref:Chemotaxis protein MotB n=1 Tax=Flavisolibacter ginsengisoli DSM 18119 TaxID=1121884 RepID=A0A1M4Y7W6_9BACT|nr:flagellar motor protein MotB [Flavisolibacter ginsengisoli]SHF01770.1 chemotaxis protein MotB [Flavisolibacter ginsengisoli DSM 18119]